MSEIVIVGGGIGGLCGALLLARDGHRVTVLERDPAPPTEPGDAWDRWARRGVTQFRLPHGFLPRFRELLEAELPDVATALEAAGAARYNRVQSLPEAITGGYRPGDERFETLTGRRPMVESVLARMVDAEPGVEVRRGVAVRGLAVDLDRPNGVPHVSGVVTDDGRTVGGDLVVDAGGRRSALPGWLAAAGARPPVEHRAEAGFVYFCRHFRAADRSMPTMLAPPNQPYDSLSIATLPADDGHWSVVVVASAADVVLRRAHRVDVWERVVRSYPLAAHWIDAEPTTGVEVMARIEDHVRRLVVDGTPVATGVVLVGDAAACTSPALGRGASIALLQVVELRDVLRDEPARAVPDAAAGLVERWTERNAVAVAPWVDDTLGADRHRRAEVACQIAGEPYHPEDPGWHLGQALMRAAPRDPDLLRAASAVGGLLERGVDVFRRPGIVERLEAVGPCPPLPGPCRTELVGIVAGASGLVGAR